MGDDAADTPAAIEAEADRLRADDRRLAAVERTHLLDTPPEEDFDAITRLAARLLGAPAAFLSIVAAERDFYKSQTGFPDDLARERELRGRTFCHYALSADDALVINDTHADPTWRSVPTVESLGVRSYVGIPIRVDGSTIGSLCVIDGKPRQWNADQIETLRQLALSASREIDLRDALAQEKREHLRSRALARAREEVLAVVAHDLRTPLQVIALGTTALQRSLAGLHAGTTERMGRAVVSISAMAESLLSGSARSLGGDVLRKPADAAELAREAVDMMSPIAERAGIVLDLQHVPRANVMVDYGQMLRVLGNLIGNAVKYSPAGSTVRVAGELLGDRLELIVQDDGQGMAPAEQARAFERGWQGADGMVRGDGAGLGLSIARVIVEQHQGTIALESELGRGTVLRVRLPVLQDAA
jgi:signal transduction histidine kinase